MSFAGQAQFDAATVPITGQRQATRLWLFLGSVTSVLPAQFLAGVPFAVTNTATPATNIGVYAVEDAIPVGWTAANISEAGVFDALNRKVKWGPFFDATPRLLTYTVVSPLLTPGLAPFSGQAWFDTNAVPITGQRQSLQMGLPIIPAPALGNLVALGGGRYRFSFSGPTGAPYTVLATTNVSLPVSQWLQLGPAVEVTSGQFAFTDTPPPGSPARFYRVRSP